MENACVYDLGNGGTVELRPLSIGQVAELLKLSRSLDFGGGEKAIMSTIGENLISFLRIILRVKTTASTYGAPPPDVVESLDPAILVQT